MNSQNFILLAVGLLSALIVTVATIDQLQQEKHPPTEVEGLIWQVENAFNRIQDLEATLQVTSESRPYENVRMRMTYIKGPPAAFSMNYVVPQEADPDSFIATVQNEAFTVEYDQLFHYMPSEGVVVSKRWLGLPLVAIGLGVFDVSQLRSDWAAGRSDIRIIQNTSGFTPFAFAPSFSVSTSFSSESIAQSNVFRQLDLLQPYSLSCSFCVDLQAVAPILSLGLSSSLESGGSAAIPGSHVLEVRDAESGNLLRMIWIDRESYLIQKVVTFNEGQREATLLIQLMTIDQGLTEADVVPPPQPGVENIRG